MSAYSNYLATGGTLARDAFYVQALHQTAQAIYLVVHQPQTRQRDDEIRRLWARFNVLANEYRAIGGTERAILDVINRVNTVVEAALRGVPDAISAVSGSIAQPLATVLWPVAIVAAAVLIIYGRK